MRESSSRLFDSRGLLGWQSSAQDKLFDDDDFHVNGTKINQVKEFKYLGSIFTEDGKLDRERLECKKQML